MSPLAEDLILRVIEDGIKRPIRILLEQRCYPAALVLMYSGMDTMAYLDMPAEKTDVMRSDFIEWAEKYMTLSDGQQLTAPDLYGARCSVLHGGAHSRFSREGKGKMIGYFITRTMQPPIDPEAAETTLVMISVEELIEAFFAAVDRFLNDLARDEQKAAVAEQRLNLLLRTFPYGC